MAALGDLYRTAWYAYANHHKKLVARAPEPVQRSTEKMLGAGNHLADHFDHTPALLVFCFNPDNMAITDRDQPRVSVVGGASIYTAVENTLLACRAEGLGCVLTTLLCQHETEVRSLLSIPEDWGTAAAVPIGYPLLGGHGPITRRPIEKLGFQDRWGERIQFPRE